jgi:hypothetical protein
MHYANAWAREHRGNDAAARAGGGDPKFWEPAARWRSLRPTEKTYLNQGCRAQPPTPP